MIRRRPAAERGHFDHGWLDTYHTFSFGAYHDSAHMGFRHLRVLNEDRVQPGQGFGTHAHWDMEILTVVIAGALAHKDTLGNGSVIRAGDVQRMTAGTGISHSEFNHSPDEMLHFLQIWLVPDRTGLEPSYEQHGFAVEGKAGRLRQLVSPEGDDRTLSIHQSASIFDARLPAGTGVSHALQPGRHAWLQVISGALQVNGVTLEAGDGAAASEERSLDLQASQECDLLLLDLA